MHTLYLGPSWAVQSFESTHGLDDPVKTNLATELGLSNFSNLSLYAKSNYDQLADAELFMQQHPELAPFRIIMVTANSLQDAHKRKNISQIDFAKKFLTSDDPLDRKSTRLNSSH